MLYLFNHLFMTNSLSTYTSSTGVCAREKRADKTDNRHSCRSEGGKQK